MAESIFLHVAHEGFKAGGQSAQVNMSQKGKSFISHGMCTLAPSGIKFHVGLFHIFSCIQVPDEISHLVALDEILR